jgi:hypothetical protein
MQAAEGQAATSPWLENSGTGNVTDRNMLRLEDCLFLKYVHIYHDNACFFALLFPFCYVGVCGKEENSDLFFVMFTSVAFMFPTRLTPINVFR